MGKTLVTTVLKALWGAMLVLGIFWINSNVQPYAGIGAFFLIVCVISSIVVIGMWIMDVWDAK